MMEGPSMEVALRVRPKFGEAVCGDAAFSVERPGGPLLLVVDGTGHGPEARDAAARAEATVRATGVTDPAALLELLDRALRGQVGAAAGVAHVDVAGRRVAYAGIGNVSARVVGSKDVRLVNGNGLLGQRFRLPREYHVELQPMDAIVMHSDGISERFDSTSFPELVWAPAARVATLLLERFGKDHDDASCLVARMPR
jgi:serine phosphatase RsbU (regulator of sigma subunit)